MPEPEFVRAAGTHFSLNGRPFRVAGANNYYLGFESDAMVEPVFDLAVQMGLNTLRTWAFVDAAAERLDRTILLAEQKGIRLILSLANYWDDFGGVNRYLQRFGLTGRDQFYRHPGVKKAYRTYVEHLLLRTNTRTGRQYRDEPAILAWELMNEPRCESPSLLLAWAAEMSSFVSILDPNHLIGVGDEGHVYELLEIPTVDFGTCHLYPDHSPSESPAALGTRWICDHIEAGHRAGKPMLIEEFGMKIDFGAAARQAAYEAWLGQVIASNGAGALVWMIAAPPYPDYDHFTVYSVEDAPAITNFARGSGNGCENQKEYSVAPYFR